VSLRRTRSRVRALYFGHTQGALRFQGVLLVLDLLIIGFFIGNQFIAQQPWFWVVDAAIAVFLAIDLLARLFAFGSFKRWFKYPPPGSISSCSRRWRSRLCSTIGASCAS
jgi:voltage-gated potassium channel